jgi:hypothetical protein
MGDLQVNLAPKDDRSRTSHEIALDMRQRSGARLPARHVDQGGRSAAAGPAGDGDPAGRNLRPGCGDPPRRRRSPSRQIFNSVPYIVDTSTTATASSVPRLRLTPSTEDNLEFFGVEQATSTTRSGASTAGNRLFASRRRPQSDRSLCAAQVGPASRWSKGWLRRRSGQHAAGRARRRRTGRCRQGRARRSALSDLPPQRPRRRDGDGRTGRRLRGADLRHARRRRRRSTAMTGALCPSRRSALTASRDDESKPTLLWDGEWEVTYVTFRDMGAAFAVALSASMFWSSRSSARSSCRWSS